MKTYKKKITVLCMAVICAFMILPGKVYAAESMPSVVVKGTTMTVGDRITLQVKNSDAKWQTNNSRIKINTTNKGTITFTAKKAGKATVSAKSANLTLKYEIKVVKHALQKKKTVVQIQGNIFQENNNQRERKDKITWKKLKGVQGYEIYLKNGNKMERVKTVKAGNKCEAICTPGKKANGQENDEFYVRGYLKKNGVTIYSQYATAEAMEE